MRVCISLFVCIYLFLSSFLARYTRQATKKAFHRKCVEFIITYTHIRTHNSLEKESRSQQQQQLNSSTNLYDMIISCAACYIYKYIHVFLYIYSINTKETIETSAKKRRQSTRQWYIGLETSYKMAF